MIRRLKFAAPLFAAVLALAPASALAQGDGLAALDAMINADGAEDWSVCTMASAYMGEVAVSEAEQALRAEELEMLVAVAMTRFVQQQGLSPEQAEAAFTAVLTARQPLYEDGSGTDIADRGRCILAGMVSQTGEEHAERLLAAYRALPPLDAALAPAVATPPPPAASPTPRAQVQGGAIVPEETFFTAALGQGEYVGAFSYYVAPDGNLVGHWSFNGAASTIYGEVATPRAPGQGLAGSYTTRGTSLNGSYEGSLDITEIAKLDGDVVTLYRMVWDNGNLRGLGLWLGDSSLGATFGGNSLGQFFRRDEGDAWELYLVTDVGGEPVLNQFRFEGGQFHGSHRVLGGENLDRAMGSASFALDGAGVVRIAMPNGQTVVAVCNRGSITGC